MNIFIDYPTAMQYWLFQRDFNATKSQQPKIPDTLYFDESAVFLSAKYGFDIPIHVSVSNKAHRHLGKSFNSHYMAGCLPKNSFIPIEKNVAIASPELCFLRASRFLNIPSLVVLACDLCAIYTRSISDPIGQIGHTPITNTNKIRSFLDDVKDVKGIKKAKTAIRFALDQSNSPMESKLAAISQIAISRGGYHILKPELNGKIKLNENGKNLVNRDYISCDMVWRDKRVVIEYDSNRFHLDKRQHYYDKQRITALQFSGYTVISITAENLQNFHSIENIFFLIRSKLGMRRYSKEFEKTYDERYDTVQEIFFSGDSLFLPNSLKQNNNVSDRIGESLKITNADI